MAKDTDIRPDTFDSFVGQRDTVAVLKRAIVAARNNGRACGHLLFAGLPGCGKTSLANIVANELGVGLKQTSGPVLERPGDLAALLTNLQPNEVLFVRCSW